MQEVQIRGAGLAFPELSDSLTRGLYCTFSDSMHVPIVESDAGLDVKLNQLATRYICISVRTSLDAAQDFPYRFCYVLDTLLNRWGRIDINHIDVLEYIAPEFASSGTYTEFGEDYATYDDFGTIDYNALNPPLGIKSSVPNQNFGFLQQDGTIYTACYANSQQAADNDDFDAAGATPKIYLGRFKIKRGHGVVLESAKINHLHEDNYLFAHNHSYNGHYIGRRAVTVKDAAVAAYYFRRFSGDSITLELQGRFSLTDLTLTFSEAGRSNMPKAAADQFYVQSGGVNVVSSGVQVTNGN